MVDRDWLMLGMREVRAALDAGELTLARKLSGFMLSRVRVQSRGIEREDPRLVARAIEEQLR